MNASVAVSQMSDGMRLFHVSGKVEASSDRSDLRVERMLGHLPALLHPQPRSVLIVGCGAGITAGSFVPHPSVEKITLCEIEPLIPKVVARYFARENYNFLSDRRTRVVYDDARHYVLTTKEKFDVITSDPIHPWVKGSATLYSREYFLMCREHLNPGGVIAQWVPLYESEVNTVRSEIATFFDVFPNGTIWSNDIAGLGYDVVLVGYAGEARIDVDQLQRRLARPDHARVMESLRDVQFRSAINLLATYAGQASDLKLWLRGAQINRDRNLRLQYMAAMGLNNSRGAAIYDEMLHYGRFPDKLFIASPPVLQELKTALGY
jgi:spermidine synthase